MLNIWNISNVEYIKYVFFFLEKTWFNLDKRKQMSIKFNDQKTEK